MSGFRRFFDMSPAEQGAACAALVMLPLAALGLRWLGLRRTQVLLAGSPSRRDASDHLERAQALARIVAAVARRGPYRAGCLPTALTLRWMLQRRGVESSLRLGVRRGAAGIEAHAWVEHRGVVLANPGHVHAFRAFDRANEANRAPAP
jgi:hypothetical protein